MRKSLDSSGIDFDRWFDTTQPGLGEKTIRVAKMATSDDDDEKLILFQCKECNVIITDSSNSDGANDNMGIVKLQGKMRK